MAPKRSAKQAFSRHPTYDEVLFSKRRDLRVDTSSDAIAVSPRQSGDGEVNGDGIRGSSASAPANLACSSLPASHAPVAGPSSSLSSNGASTTKTTPDSETAPDSKAPVRGVAGQNQAKKMKRKTVVDSGSSGASLPTVTLSSAPAPPGDAGSSSSFITTAAVPTAPTPAAAAAAIAATTAAFRQHDWRGVVDLKDLPGWRGQFRDLFTGRVEYIGGESRENSETTKDSKGGEAGPTKRAREG